MFSDEKLSLVGAFVVSALLCLYTTPLARKAALFFGIVDIPDDKLKKHDSPTPYLGGIALFVSVLITASSFLFFDNVVLGILLSSSIIIIVGILDDLQALKPSVKLAGQIFAALTVIKSGVMIDVVNLPWWVNFPLTVFWLLTCMNAFNIIDILDGMCSLSAFFSAVLIAFFAFAESDYQIATLSIILCGSLLGFLRYNKPKATIFLGDSGSMLIGLLVGALSMRVGYSHSYSTGIFAPLFILFVPLYDLVYVVLIRIAKKKPFYLGSPDHFALRLRKKGFSDRKILYVISVFALLSGFVSFSLVYIALPLSFVIAGIFVLLSSFFGIILLKTEV
ncbi:undecaprenyl/decaprenyl-phosphate alpha-N-acetylglucosaminyl 1-phosphate transferase [candidate division WOR-3 bacterium]|nr:undecaprenyl/decaprenyl-phosphate alpha-N-acetylglucosaminyl 1-phosphate transferase [candidate division WOR-3 bacterium]